MDRKTALEILDLHENATPEEVSRRYDVLFKKFRYKGMDEKGHTKEQMEEAYRILMGLDYIDPEIERKKKERQEHPNPLFKLLRINEEKARNAIYYYKWTVLIVIVLLVVAVSTVLSIVNRVEPDLKIIFAGNIYIEDTTPLEDSIKTGMENIKAPQIQCITLSDSQDSQMQYAAVQKLTVEMMGGNNDIFIMDLKTYQDYASYGYFKALDGLSVELGIKSIDKNLEVAVKNEGGGQESPPSLYGVDVSGSPLLRDCGVMGDTLIATLFNGGDNPQNAEDYLKKLIESVQ